MWWKKNKWKIIVPVLVLAVLAAAFWYGGGAPGAQGQPDGKPEPTQTSQPPEAETSPFIEPGETETPVVTETPAITPEGSGETVSNAPESKAPAAPDGSAPPEMQAVPSPPPKQEIDPETGKDQYQTGPVPAGKPLPVEPEEVKIGTTAYTCTISIACPTILKHMDWLDPEKTQLVPEDGWISKPTQVTFYQGESVFNVLRRTCKQLKIHMEFVDTPIYNSAYIEGIGNLYEFDCGELSGWMYKVNEWFPNYGCSRYQLKNGDVICWVYTCDLGADIGGSNALRG